jgi:D-alanine-D-alanine ligase
MSYAAKWLENTPEYKATSVTCPAEVEPAHGQLICQAALQAFRAVGGRGYGRVDIRCDEDGNPYVLEVNCNPCLDDEMGLARSAAAAGWSYADLLQFIVRAALEPMPFDYDIPMLPEPVRRTPQLVATSQ